MTKTIAVITGASSGLGKKYVQTLVQDSELEEIWIIARRADRLTQLQTLDMGRIIPLSLDLVKEESMTALKSKLENEDVQIRLLINAAGLGKLSTIRKQPLEQAEQMINLNIKALTEVTSLCLPYMHKGSGILQIASVASFMPMPGLAVYGASKAYVREYSVALRNELKKEGIHVTAVCPYWIEDTEFIAIAENKETTESRYPFADNTDNVVKKSLKALKKNQAVCTPDPVSTIGRIASRLMPETAGARVVSLFLRD